MNSLLIKILSIVALGCMGWVKALAQEDPVISDELQVIKAFEVRLLEASIIDIRPQVVMPIPVKKVYDYKMTISPLELEYPAPVIKPLATADIKNYPRFNHFVKVGYGTIKDPQVDLGLAFGDNNWYSLALRGSYDRLDNTANVPFQQMQDIYTQLDGWVRLGENNKLDLAVNYEGQDRNWYDTRQLKTERYGDGRFNNVVSTSLKVTNIEPSLYGVDYSLSSRTGLLFNDVDGRELHYGLSGSIGKRRSDHIAFDLPIDFDFYANEYAAKPLANLHLAPSVNFNYGQFQARAGVDYIYNNNKVNSIWPAIELSYGLARGYFQPFIGVGQTQYINNITNILDYSPFIEFEAGNIRSTISQSYYGGLRGELNFMSYEFKGGYRQSEDQAFFDNRLALDSLSTDLVVQFDDVNTIFAQGVIRFKFSESLELGGSLTYNYYDMMNIATHVGLPSLQGRAFANYSLIPDKLVLRGDLFIADATPVTIYGSEGGVDSRLNNQVELNATIEYWPWKYVALHAYGRNLLDNKYQRWHGYPVVGINVGGGLIVKF